MTIRRGDTVVLAGTKKGLFVLHSRDRKRWRIEKPSFAGLPVYHAISDGRRVFAAATNEHWGPSVRRSDSWGAGWAKSKDAPQYAKDSGLSVERAWHLALDDEGALWAGVEPAGLFVSRDDGDSWQGIDGLNAQKDRSEWMPGGGGLCLHTILPYPGEPSRMLVAASAVGILGTNDGGGAWRLMNGGIRADFMPSRKTDETTLGSCPHKLVRDARDPAIVYMQNHCGVYRRRRGDAKWTAIQTGLPSRFGFPMAAHPHDGGTVYTVPLVADTNRVTPDGAMTVYRTTNHGKQWEPLTAGLPRQDAYHTILREGLATDSHDPAGVYVGTTTGQVYGSRDGGDSWMTLAETLPPVLSVSATVVQ